MKKSEFDPHFNNRMPLYVEKDPPPYKPRHREIKDGVSIWVDGKKPNPFLGVDVANLSLEARIKAGTFVDAEGVPLKLEKVQGSDKLSKELEDFHRKYDNAKDEQLKREREEKLQELTDKYIDKLSNPKSE